MPRRPTARVRGQRPEHWAALYPDHPAVVDGPTVLTYAAWNRRADLLADALARRRIDADTAAVCLPPCADWFVVSLALAKLGWRQVALPPGAPAEQTRRALADTGAGVLFCQGAEPGGSGRSDPAARCAALVVAREPAPGELGLAEVIGQGAPVERQSAAEAPLVLYTSGTTGARKGVDRSAAEAGPADGERLARLREYQRDVADSRDARMHNRTLLTLPMHHGTGPGFAQRALSMAGTVYVLHPYDPVAALRLIDRARITHWAVTPAALHRLRTLPRDLLLAFEVSSVETINAAGGEVPLPLRRWISAYFGQDRLHCFFGTTETGVISSMPPEVERLRPESSGRIHLHVDIRVLGADGRAAAPGTEGELLVRTPQTAAGYVGAHAPRIALEEDGFLRTGDYGRIDEDGYVYVSTRVQNLINRPGGPVSPAAAERALAEHRAVLEAAVIGVPAGAADQTAVAFCETEPGAPADRDGIVAALAGLDPAQRPRHVVFLDELPRNDVGKVLRGVLREQFPDEAALAAAAGTGAGSGVAARFALDLEPGPADAAAASCARPAQPSGAGPAVARPGAWYDRDGLDRAWRAVRAEAEGDVQPDPQLYREFALDWPAERERILTDLAAGRYRPRRARLLEVPKGPLNHRPVLVLDPADRVVYCAMVEAARPALSAALGPEVFGAGASGPAGGTSTVARQWLDFEQAARSLAREAQWSLSTDVTAYAESIDLGILADDLGRAGVPAGLAADLVAFLDRLCRGSGAWGLAHDQNASAVLGNFYLSAGDAVLRRQGVGFVRIMDDIRMFDSAPDRLVQAFAQLERELRARRLIMSGGKTQLLPAKELVARFVPRRLDPRESFDAARTAGEGQVREIRFALGRLAAADDSYAVDWLLDHLPELPALAVATGYYLSRLVPRRPDLAGRLGPLLEERSGALHPFVAVGLLQALDAAAEPEPAALAAARRWLGDRAAPTALRTQAARYLGRHGAAADLPALAGAADSSDSEQPAADCELARAADSARRRINARSSTSPATASQG